MAQLSNVTVGATPRRADKTITFDNTAGNGAVGTVALFTTTGAVLVKSIGVSCTADLTGALATISLGVVGNVGGLITVTTATTIDSGQIWADGTPTANLKALPAALKDILINSNMQYDILTAGITGGVLKISVVWEPASGNGNLV